MKLHLPKLLRNAVLTCIASVAGITTTVGTATVVGGSLAFVLAPQAVASTYTVTKGTDNFFHSCTFADENGQKPHEVGDITNTADNQQWTVFSGDRDHTLRFTADSATSAGVTLNIQFDSLCFGAIEVAAGSKVNKIGSNGNARTFYYGNTGSYNSSFDENFELAASAGLTFRGTHSISIADEKRLALNSHTTVQGGVSISGGEVSARGNLTIAENASLTLDSALSATSTYAITNNGAITLNGTLQFASLEGMQGVAGSLSHTTHGYCTDAMTYNLIVGSDTATLQTGEGFSLVIGESTIDASDYTVSGGSLLYSISGETTVYEILSSYAGEQPITYTGRTGDFEKATGFKLEDGTTLCLSTSLDDQFTDKITVVANATATLDLQNTGDTETVLQAGSLELKSGAHVALTGNGVYRNGSVTNHNSVLLNGGVTIADAWTGTIELTGGGADASLDGYVNNLAGKVRLNGLLCYVQNQTVSKDLELVNNGTTSAVRLHNGTSTTDQTGTFSGAISGSGDIRYTWTNAGDFFSNHVFTGDVSNWDGWFISDAAAGKKVGVEFKSGGNVFAAAGNGGVRDDRASDFHLHVLIEATPATTFNGSIVNAASLTVNSETTFKKDITATAMTVAGSVNATLDSGVTATLGSLAGTVTVNGGTVTLGAVAAETTATIAGTEAIIGGTIANSGTLNITADSIKLVDDISQYVVKTPGSVKYSLDGVTENTDGSQNGFEIVSGGEYYLVQGGTNSVTATQVTTDSGTYNITTGDDGVVMALTGSASSASFRIVSGTVVVDSVVQSKATAYLLEGGIMQVTEGSVSGTAIDASGVAGEDGSLTAGVVVLDSGATMTDLSTAAHAALIGAVTGDGTMEISAADAYGTVISSAEGFTGTTYVKSGKFTLNSSTYGETLKLGEGVWMQVTAAEADFTDTMVLEKGKHQVHVNENKTLNISGVISGEGTFEKQASGKVNILEGASVANYENALGTTNVKGGSVNAYTHAEGTTNVEAGSIGSYAHAAGITNVQGGALTSLSTTGGTVNVTAGSVSTLAVSGGNANVKGGTVAKVTATGGTFYMDDSVDAEDNPIIPEVKELVLSGAAFNALGGSVGDMLYSGGEVHTDATNGEESVVGTLKVTGKLTVADSAAMTIAGTGTAEVAELKLGTGSSLNVAGALTLGSIEFGGLGASAALTTLGGESTEVLLGGLLDAAGHLDKTTLLTLANAGDCLLQYEGTEITADGVEVTHLSTEEQTIYKLAWVDNALTLEYVSHTDIMTWEDSTDGFGSAEGTWAAGTTDNAAVSFAGNGASEVAVDAAGVKAQAVVVDAAGVKYELSGGDVEVTGNLEIKNGQLSVTDNAVNVGQNLTIAEGGTLTVDTGATVVVTNKLTAMSDLSIDGTLEAGKLEAETLTNTGTLEAGTLEAEMLTNTGTLEAGTLETGTLTNTGALTVTEQLAAEKLTINNALTTDGSVQIMAASLTGLTQGADVVIDLGSDALASMTTAGQYGLLSLDEVAVDAEGAFTGLTISDEVIAYFKALGQKVNLVEYAPVVSTFSLRAGSTYTTIAIDLAELTAEDQTWDTSLLTDAVGETVARELEDGSLALVDGNSTLDDVLSVKVTKDTTLNLTGGDNADAVNINGLAGTGDLSLVGDGDVVNITDGALKAALNLDGVAAQFSDSAVDALSGSGDDTSISGEVKLTGTGSSYTGAYDGATVEIAAGTHSLKAAEGLTVTGSAGAVTLTGGEGAALATTGTNVQAEADVKKLTGSMTGGKLSLAATPDTTGLQLNKTDLGVTLAASAANKQALNVAAGDKVVLAKVGAAGSTVGKVDVTITGGATGFDLEEKYFSGAYRYEGTSVVADRNTSYYSDKAGASVSANGAEGLAMADTVLVKLNPQAAEKQGALATVLNALDTAGSEAADELGTSLTGASTAVLGMAVSGDVDRQLQAIRNRTTTMGVDQSVANEDMPYFNAWINAEGDRSELSESGTEGGYELNSWGGTVGFDVDLCPTFTAGMALTAMYGDLDTTGADKASGDIDTYYVTAFARYAPSAWTHTFVATVGMSDISLDRKVAGTETKGETDGLSFGLMYEVGRVFALDEDGTTCLQPVFNVTWKHTTVDAYTEDGGDLALDVDEQTIDTVTFGLGARLQTVVGESMYNRTSILEARVLAKADVGDRSGSADVALAALPGATASVDSAEMGAFGLEAGAGLTIPVGQEGGSIFMDASVELRSDYTNVNGTVGYRINF